MRTDENEESNAEQTSFVCMIVKEPIPLQSIYKIKNYSKPKEPKSSEDEDDDEYDSSSWETEDSEDEHSSKTKGRNSSHNKKPYSKQVGPYAKQRDFGSMESNNPLQKLENMCLEPQPGGRIKDPYQNSERLEPQPCRGILEPQSGSGMLKNLPGNFLPMEMSPNLTLESSPESPFSETQTAVYKMTSSTQNSVALQIIIDGQMKNSSLSEICTQLKALVSSKSFGESFLNVNEDGMDAFTYAAVHNMREVVIQLKEIFFNYFTPEDAISLLRRTDTHGNALIHEVASISGDKAVQTLEELLNMRYNGKKIYDIWTKNNQGENVIRFCMLRSPQFPFKLIKLFHDLDPKILTTKDSKGKNILHILIDTCNLRCRQNTSADAISYGASCLQFLLHFEIIKTVCVLEKDNNNKNPLDHLKVVNIRPPTLWLKLFSLLDKSTKQQLEITKNMKTIQNMEIMKCTATTKQIEGPKLEKTSMVTTQTESMIYAETGKQRPMNVCHCFKTMQISTTEWMDPGKLKPNETPIHAKTTLYPSSAPSTSASGSLTPDVLSPQGTHSICIVDSTKTSYPTSITSLPAFPDIFLPQSIQINSSPMRSTVTGYPTSRRACSANSMSTTSTAFGSQTSPLLSFSKASITQLINPQHENETLTSCSESTTSAFGSIVLTPTLPQESQVYGPQSLKINSPAIESTLTTVINPIPMFSSVSPIESPMFCDVSSSEAIQTLDDLSSILNMNDEMNNYDHTVISFHPRKESRDDFYACFNKLNTQDGLQDCAQVFQNRTAADNHVLQVHGPVAFSAIPVDTASCMDISTKGKVLASAAMSLNADDSLNRNIKGKASYSTTLTPRNMTRK